TNSKTILKYVEVLSSIKCPDRTKNKTRGPQLKKEQTSDRAVNPIQIMPNPASDFIYINGLNAEHGNTLVKMYSMNGIQVINQEFNSLIGDNKINVSSLQTGVYFVTVSNNDFSYKQKIIIE
ncbi:MAG: T9SS type A sorting domain-containing protein, partial [Saprospiraceae bacterium]